MSDRVDLHAIDDGSGLLIPIFAMLVSRQDGRRYGRERTEGDSRCKGRKREREVWIAKKYGRYVCPGLCKWKAVVGISRVGMGMAEYSPDMAGMFLEKVKQAAQSLQAWLWRCPGLPEGRSCS